VIFGPLFLLKFIVVYFWCGVDARAIVGLFYGVVSEAAILSSWVVAFFSQIWPPSIGSWPSAHRSGLPSLGRGLSSPIWLIYIGSWSTLHRFVSLHWDVASPSQIWPLSIEPCPLTVYSRQSYPFGTRVLSAGKFCGYKGLITEIFLCGVLSVFSSWWQESPFISRKEI
jgi:hypothetical protein